MNSGGIATSARRCIIWIGKYAPFFIVAIVTLSNTETMYSILAERYATFDGMVVYYKPISWWIGERFELSIAWIFALFVLSFGVEACVWNRACIVFLSLMLLQKDFFLEHTIDETMFCFDVFCERSNKRFQEEFGGNNLFGEKVDCKQFLEDYFEIKFND